MADFSTWERATLEWFAREATEMMQAQGAPVAWMHTMDNTDGDPENTPSRALTFSPENPFGVAGINYSAEYPVTSVPLYTAAPAMLEGWQLVQIAEIERKDAAIAELVAAGQAVVDRWDSPAWKDQPHTGEFIARLRAAIAKHT